MTATEKAILRRLGLAKLRAFQKERQARYSYWYHGIGELPAETVQAMNIHSRRFYIETTGRDCENWRWKAQHGNGGHRDFAIQAHKQRIECGRQCRLELQGMGQALVV